MTVASFMRKRSVALFAALLFVLAAGLASLKAQQEPSFPGVPLTRGQDVSPTYDGWERNADGTITMYFGYFNRNAEEDVDVPLGPNNAFDLGNGDQGQPTHFYPGRKWWVFKVVVPQDWPKDKRLVWTLNNRGHMNQAKGWLQPEWEVIKDGIILSGFRNRVAETAAGGYKVPISVTGGPAQTITLPATAKLTATATPLSAEGCEGDALGRCASGVDLKRFQVRWSVYRGAGKVQIDPEVSPSVGGKPITSEPKVTFPAPGKYRLRATATDGSSFATYDVDVTVNPGASVANAH
jgi:hypothetical protein